MMTGVKERLPGKLIAVEGLDGSGKSTQIRLVHQWLQSKGHRVFFSEWNSSVLVREATRKAKKRHLLTPTTFSLIHATDFADRYERQMLPLLRAGYLVLCDRYIFTAFARDAVRGCDRMWLRKMYGFARSPDITLFLKLPLGVALGRILQGRPQLKHFEAGMDLNLSPDVTESFRIFQERVLKEYLCMVEEFGFTVIDASESVHGQQVTIRGLIQDRVDLGLFHAKSVR
jgi:dTMP kinase